jgi:hypothetical protein
MALQTDEYPDGNRDEELADQLVRHALLYFLLHYFSLDAIASNLKKMALPDKYRHRHLYFFHKVWGKCILLDS